MAKNQNTYEKKRREVEKKRKAEEKRQNRRKKKEIAEDTSDASVADSESEHEEPQVGSAVEPE